MGGDVEVEVDREVRVRDVVHHAPRGRVLPVDPQEDVTARSRPRHPVRPGTEQGHPLQPPTEAPGRRRRPRRRARAASPHPRQRVCHRRGTRDSAPAAAGDPATPNSTGADGGSRSDAAELRRGLPHRSPCRCRAPRSMKTPSGTEWAHGARGPSKVGTSMARHGAVEPRVVSLRQGDHARLGASGRLGLQSPHRSRPELTIRCGARAPDAPWSLSTTSAHRTDDHTSVASPPQPAHPPGVHHTLEATSYRPILQSSVFSGEPESVASRGPLMALRQVGEGEAPARQGTPLARRASLQLERAPVRVVFVVVVVAGPHRLG